MSRTKLTPKLKLRLIPITKFGADNELYLVGYRRKARSRKAHQRIGLARALHVVIDGKTPRDPEMPVVNQLPDVPAKPMAPVLAKDALPGSMTVEEALAKWGKKTEEPA